MERLKLDDRVMHMVFGTNLEPLYWTAARKQKEAVEYFMEDREGTWEDAVVKGFRAMKILYSAVDKTHDSLMNDDVRLAQRTTPTDKR